jgi:hypothetical protein
MGLWRQGTDLKRRAEWLASQTFVVLAIQIPKMNDKGPASIEQFFSALHGIYRNDPQVQEYISFEIVAERESIIFYVFTPIHLREFIEGQLYAQVPDLEIKQVPDYTTQAELGGLTVATTEIQLVRDQVFPIKTYPTIEVDPLAGITAVMSKLETGERIWLQLVVQPVGDTWQEKGVKYIQLMRDGKDPEKKVITGGVIAMTAGKAGRFVSRLAKEALQPGSGLDDKAAESKDVKLTSPQEAAIKGIESKIQKSGYEVQFRLVVITGDEITARSRTQAVLAALKQFNATALNGFATGQPKINDFPSWQQYISREFEQTGKILNIEELASVYHFPTSEVETSAISWSGSKKGEAPFNLPLKSEVDPLDLTILGRTDFRNQAQEFGVKMDDRMRHVYVIGKSGTGKSTLLENMVIDDINEGRGVIVVDPHGELADKAIAAIPEHRIKDAIIFDPSDRDFPIAFNILDVTHPDQKGNIASGFVSSLKKIFGNSWGPRLEYILRNATLAILDTEHPTMLGIPRMLTDAAFRNQVIPQIKDPVVLDFWKNEWAAKEQRQQVEEMGSILNKVGQFLSSSIIRNIVGQPKSGFDMRKAMDERKILIVNLSKGKMGEDNSALLGTMMITKVQLAAMSRADVDPSQRPQSFLYVDEFQNFATESFATILSEARKYNLGLTIAHQYIAQMSPEVKDAVFGNVGTMISFRVGSDDASALKPEFTPVFDENDLVNLQRGHVYIKELIDGLAMPAFSAQTMPPRAIPEPSFREEVIQHSRTEYALSREEAEALIDETAGYKQKREASEASAAAATLLQQAPPPARPNAAYTAPVISATPRPLPADKPFVPIAKPAPTPVPEPVQQVQTPPPVVQILVAEQKPKKPTIERPLKIMNGRSYKEMAQRGGMKWLVGESEADAIARRENRRAIEEGRANRLETGDDTTSIEASSLEVLTPASIPMVTTPAPVPQVAQSVQLPVSVMPKPVLPIQTSPQPSSLRTEHSTNTPPQRDIDSVPSEVWDAVLGDSDDEKTLTEGNDVQF